MNDIKAYKTLSKFKFYEKWKIAKISRCLDQTSCSREDCFRYRITIDSPHKLSMCGTFSQLESLK